ncbi:MAG: type II secretion system F family protein [Candidatus Omnitrophota bacterium]
MPFFRYKVRDRFGASVTGLIEGEASKSVALNLRKLGYSIIYIEEQGPFEVFLDNFLSKIKKIKNEEVVLFTRQLSAMIKSGLPLLVSLESTLPEIGNKKFKDIVAQVKKDVEGGASFHEALSKHTTVFSPLYVNMVKAGESAGILDAILERLAQLGLRDIELKSKIRAAFIYPAVLLSLAIAVIIFLLVAVLPKFIAIFEASDMRLPLPTIILITLSRFLKDFFIPLAFIITFAVVLFLRYIRSDKGRYNLHHFFLNIPVFGPLWLKIIVARFAYILSYLTKSGVPLLSALAVVEGTVGNAVVVHALQHVRSSLTEGQSLAEPFRASGLFPAMVVQMISVGEKTGKLDTMLEDVANFYELDTGYAIRNMTALLEPILLLCMGLLVGFIALSVLLPIFNVVRAMQH